MRRKEKKIIPILAVVIVLLIGIVGFLAYEYISANNNIANLTSELNSNTQTVYVASTMIEKGTKVEAEGEEANVQMQVIRTGLESYNYLTADDMGKIAAVDIPEGLPVTYNMISEEVFDTDTREYEISVVNLATTQKENDYVDIRIMFPNGEDYIILSKRQIRELSLENNVFTTTANEEEILRMSSAIVDAYTMTGAYIYSTKYIESNVQEDAVPTYPVKSETLDLINSDPNILTRAIDTLNLSARLSLERRLGLLTEEQLAAVAEGHGIHDSAKTSVLTENAQNQFGEDEVAPTDMPEDALGGNAEVTEELVEGD